MPRRIASLLPATTELVCALGARDELVGVSHECDHPSGLGDLPRLTAPRLELPATSAGIHRTIGELVRQVLSPYVVDAEALRAAEPDLILTQDLCEVCAVSPRDLEAELGEFLGREFELVRSSPTRLTEVFDQALELGKLLGRTAAGENLASSLHARVLSIAERSRAATTRPTVLTLEWLDPPLPGGTWMPELIDAAGGRAVQAEAGQKAEPLDQWTLTHLDPDVVLIKPCGFSLERTLEELEADFSPRPWESWRAWDDERVYVADGNALFNRPGPRLVDSCELAAALLHPGLFAEEKRRHASWARRLGPMREGLPW